MKYRLIPMLLVFAFCAAAQTLVYPNRFVELSLPPQQGLENYLKQMPLESILARNGNRTRVSNIAGAGLMYSFSAKRFAAKPFSIRVTGRALSGDTRAELTLWLHGLHWRHSSCVGSKVEGKSNWTMPLNFPVDREETLSLAIPFDATTNFCNNCKKVLEDGRFSATLRLKAPENNAIGDFGIEISRFEIVSGFPLDSQIENESNFPDLVDKILAEHRARRAAENRQKVALMTTYPRDNRFSAVRFTGLPKDASKRDWNLRYFTHAELETLNPRFLIRKLVGWNVVDNDDAPKLPPEKLNPPRISKAFTRKGVAYGYGDDFLLRFRPGGSGFDYLWSDYPNGRNFAVFPEAAGEVFRSGHYDYRLDNGKEVELPEALRQAKAAMVGQFVYRIAPDRKSLQRAKAAGGDWEPFPFPAPEVPEGIRELRTLSEIRSNGQEPQLLLFYEAYSMQSNSNLLYELNLETMQLRLKFPPILRSFWPQKSEKSQWLYQQDGVELVDLGLGKPFGMLKTGKKISEELKQLNPIPLPLAEFEYDYGAPPVRVGSYLAFGSQKCGQIVWLNMFVPKASLRLHGFEQYNDICLAEDGKGILVTMPNGLFDVRVREPYPMPELPDPARNGLYREVSLKECFGEFEPATPALFDGRMERDASGKERIVFTAAPRAAECVIRVRFKHPGGERPCRLFFAGDHKNKLPGIRAYSDAGEFLTVYTENTNGRSIPPRTAWLFFKLESGDSPQSFIIEKAAQPRF